MPPTSPPPSPRPTPGPPSPVRAMPRTSTTTCGWWGLALACSTNHQIPLACLPAAGNLPDVKVFEEALPNLVSRLEALGVEPASVTRRAMSDIGDHRNSRLPITEI